MGNLRIAAVGAMVCYATEVSAGSGIPSASSAWTKLVDVSEAPAIEETQEMVDASCITEEGRTYVKGHTDHTQNGTLIINHTDAAMTAYETAKTACDNARTAGKRFYFQYYFPSASKAYFFTAELGRLGTDGLNENAVNVPAPIGVGEVAGWSAKVQPGN